MNQEATEDVGGRGGGGDTGNGGGISAQLVLSTESMGLENVIGVSAAAVATMVVVALAVDGASE